MKLLLVILAVVLAFSSVQAQTIVTNKYPWESTAAAGLTLTKGNSDTLLFTAKFLTDKKTVHNEYNFGADGTYGKSDGVENAEQIHGFGQWDHTFYDDLYGYVRTEGLRDAIADIKYRVTLGPGVGYYFIKDKATTLSVEGGASYVFQRLGTNATSYATLRLAQKYDHKFTAYGTHIWETVEILPQVDKFQNYLFNAEVGIEASIAQNLSLQTYLDDNFNSEPANGRKRNDVKLVSAIAYKF